MTFWLKLKKIFINISAIALILVLIFSPYLLIVDFKEYSPFVITVWILSAVYYMFIKGRRE